MKKVCEEGKVRSDGSKIKGEKGKMRQEKCRGKSAKQKVRRKDENGYVSF